MTSANEACHVTQLNYAAIEVRDLKGAVSALDRYMGEAREIEKSHPAFDWRSNYARVRLMPLLTLLDAPLLTQRVARLTA